jgi:hypothetical protein
MVLDLIKDFLAIRWKEDAGELTLFWMEKLDIIALTLLVDF